LEATLLLLAGGVAEWRRRAIALVVAGRPGVPANLTPAIAAMGLLLSAAVWRRLLAGARGLEPAGGRGPADGVMAGGRWRFSWAENVTFAFTATREQKLRASSRLRAWWPGWPPSS
jgi:hypothetical protein